MAISERRLVTMSAGCKHDTSKSPSVVTAFLRAQRQYSCASDHEQPAKSRVTAHQAYCCLSRKGGARWQRIVELLRGPLFVCGIAPISRDENPAQRLSAASIERVHVPSSSRATRSSPIEETTMTLSSKISEASCQHWRCADRRRGLRSRPRTCVHLPGDRLVQAPAVLAHDVKVEVTAPFNVSEIGLGT